MPLSTTMSAPAASSKNSRRSGSLVGFSTVLRLLALCNANGMLTPSIVGSARRATLPSGGSTFSTSAPRSASSRVTASPVPSHRSSTRTPASNGSSSRMTGPLSCAPGGKPGSRYRSPGEQPVLEPATTDDRGLNDVMTATTPDEVLEQIDRWWRTANYLSVGQIYLLNNPLLQSAAVPRRRQTPAARPLGHHSRAELPLRPSQPGDRTARTVDDLHHRTGPRRSRPGRQRLPRRHLHRDLPRHHSGRRGPAPAVPPVLLPRRYPVARRP